MQRIQAAIHSDNDTLPATVDNGERGSPQPQEPETCYDSKYATYQTERT